MDGLQKKDPSTQLWAVAAGGSNKAVIVEILGVVQVVPEGPCLNPPLARRTPPSQPGQQPPQEPAYRHRWQQPPRRAGAAATAAHPSPTTTVVQAHQRHHCPLSSTLTRAFTTAGVVLGL